MSELNLDRSGGLPPPQRGLIASVAIPARNEAERIERTLTALDAQRNIDGDLIAAHTFEVVVFANGCTDETAARVRAFALRHRRAVYVLEADLPEASRHVGTARRAVMNLCAARLERVAPRGFVATTDADTIPSPTCIAETCSALESADAVGGRIVLDPVELGAFDAESRALVELETRYRFAIARLEALRDPVAWDPWPRHAQCFGTSLAVRVGAYNAAGGLPALPALEDLALRAALDSNDARFRHSLRVRVRTSARRASAVAGGLATYLGTLTSHAAQHRPFLVPHPGATLRRIDGRAALRRIMGRTGTPATPLDRAIVLDAYAVTHDDLTQRIHTATTLGALVQALEDDAEIRRIGAASVPLHEAVTSLERFARALDANAPLAGTPGAH